MLSDCRPAHHFRDGCGDLRGAHGRSVHPHRRLQNFTFHDLTQEIDPISDHWANENIHFDAIYTGYLGSSAGDRPGGQVLRPLRRRRHLVDADPAMADNGVLYPGFTPEFAKKMGELCGKADVIVPNLTEASFMLGIDYVGDDYDEAYIKSSSRT